MTSIPILQGIKADAQARLRTSLPVNLEPVITDSGISKGSLRLCLGITAIANGPGADRGGILWNGIQYRVMGSKLVKLIDGAVFVIGDVGDDGLPVSLDYGFGLLSIGSAGGLFYLDSGVVKRVGDTDLGTVVDQLWLDGGYITTDGTYIILTDLNDPYSVNPLRYGSAEQDPDKLVGLMKVRGELYGVGRDTIEVFRNVGGSGFRYQRVDGALIPKGCVGTFAKAYFADTFAFVGSGRNEATSVFLAGGGEAISISTPEVDTTLAGLTNVQLASIEMESRTSEDEQRLLMHLPDRTLCYLLQASKAAGTPIWIEMRGDILMTTAYPLRHLVNDNGRWIGGTSGGRLGYLDIVSDRQFDVDAGWRFDTVFLYNQAMGGIIDRVELVGLPGSAPIAAKPRAYLSMTTDGVTYGQEKMTSAGKVGQRDKRIVWRPHRRFRNYIGMRFRGSGGGKAAWIALEVDVEGLSV